MPGATELSMGRIAGVANMLHGGGGRILPLKAGGSKREAEQEILERGGHGDNNRMGKRL